MELLDNPVGRSGHRSTDARDGEPTTAPAAVGEPGTPSGADVVAPGWSDRLAGADRRERGRATRLVGRRIRPITTSLLVQQTRRCPAPSVLGWPPGAPASTLRVLFDVLVAARASAVLAAEAPGSAAPCREELPQLLHCQRPHLPSVPPSKPRWAPLIALGAACVVGELVTNNLVDFRRWARALRQAGQSVWASDRV